jgi:GNAT superfamily N-acetyltransferase
VARARPRRAALPPDRGRSCSACSASSRSASRSGRCSTTTPAAASGAALLEIGLHRHDQDPADDRDEPDEQERLDEDPPSVVHQPRRVEQLRDDEQQEHLVEQEDARVGDRARTAPLDQVDHRPDEGEGRGDHEQGSADPPNPALPAAPGRMGASPCEEHDDVTSTSHEDMPPQRLARASDAARISALMRASVLDLFPHFYDQRQTASAAVHIAHLDMRLIEDGTYFVHEADGEIVACGGWSRRHKLFTGSGAADDDDRLLDPATEPARVRAMFVRGDWTRRGLGRAILSSCERAARAEGFRNLVLGATLPGEPLYRSFGFREVERFTLTMPDGVSVECVAMERPVGSTTRSFDRRS